MATSVNIAERKRVLVVPLIRVPPTLAMLSYTVPEGVHVSLGDSVQIPFRTKAIEGIVWAKDASKPRNDMKALLGRGEGLSLTPEQLRIAQWLHTETLTSLNVILRSMVRGIGGFHRSAAQQQQKVTIVECQSHAARQNVLQQWAKRLAAERATTLIVVPHYGAGTEWLALLAKLQPVQIVPTRSIAAERQLRTQLVATKIFLTTHVGLLAPLPKIDRVILDLADDEAYFAFDQAPRVDVRSLAATFARVHGATFLILTRWMSPVVAGISPSTVPTILGTRPSVTVIDRQGEPPSERGHLPPSYLLEKLQYTRTLWLHTRTSEAGRYVCSDCGTIVVCPTCSKPFRVLARSPLTLECVRDHVRIEAPSTCTVCKGTKLSTRGAGIQQVARTVADFVGSGEVATLERSAQSGTIERAKHVIATTAIGSHPTKPFDAVALLQPDSYFSLPGYRSAEKFFSTLALARTVTAPHGALYIVTHKPETPAYKFLDDPDAWTKQTWQERATLHYPPAATLIVLQPRKRSTQPAEVPFSSPPTLPGVIETHLGSTWLLRAAQPQHGELLQWVQQHLDPSWEATVNPPELPLD
jgi:primosomal protein N'